ALWRYDTYGRNLLGTARTLDNADGSVGVDVGAGIFGRDGYALLDDSDSPVLENGEYVLRESGTKDYYFFGYGDDYEGGLKDFFRLSGPTPLIPRYALGNWWSRYYAYTEESYNSLLDHFRMEEVPLSVAVIDMDWHLVDIDPSYGSGWTGYTWNEKLFPDYRRFLKNLHERNLAVTLNLHPALGIRGFETMYPEAAKEMGMDPEKKETISFNMSSPDYRRAYFEKVLHPYEKDGVDFWWIDWQQGTGEGKKVDPLFLLNHYHYQDLEGRSSRAMIFSRYAGPGSHRTPIGFSGDTRITWRSLDFQPYFTAMASNIGFFWWSHDIGGHMGGDKDMERLIRWIQLGVLSPIFRLHSSRSPFINKEPWTMEEPYRSVTDEWLRFRHRLVPYLYTMMILSHEEGLPLVRPLYYEWKKDEAAYHYGLKNEYLFGKDLLVSPITSPEDPALRMGCARTLIPEGTWYDLFTGQIYKGRKIRNLYRPISSIPVLMKAGTVLPLSAEDRQNGVPNPKSLKIVFACGKNGSFTLCEDDGISPEGKCGRVLTKMSLVSGEEGDVRAEISSAEGDLSLIPSKRNYSAVFYGLESSDET
ncbi:MAG: DUF5110 domain-containing protein, partial [Clostridia bacterium]|nr:DUF5110 domain-containing protein [Clostridia bacterium]